MLHERVDWVLVIGRSWSVQDSIVSGNTASGQGSAFNVANAELVSFDNVTFADNLGQLPPLHNMLRYSELPQDHDPAAPMPPG